MILKISDLNGVEVACAYIVNRYCVSGGQEVEFFGIVMGARNESNLCQSVFLWKFK